MSELPLGFQREILTEIVAEDGLLILARGLGLRKILCSLLKLYTDESHLVLLVNSSPAEDTAINDELACMGVPAHQQMKIIEYETPAETRSDMYRKSGIFSITSRILAVDMLLNRIPLHLITGIIVHNAHSVSATSMESFILQLYREENEQGFIKAFSDQSESFVTGFAPLQNTLKSLFLRKVHIWPRFHVMVADDLEIPNESIIELRQPMSEKMDKIQHGIVECMDACLSDIKRSNTMVDLQEFTVENSMFKSFDTIIRRQLDPNWHRVSIKTKQLVADLKLLRQLLTYLAGYDCVTFYSFLQTIMAANTPSDGKLLANQSPWLLMDAANIIFSLSKKRFFVEEKDEEYMSVDPVHIPGVPKRTKLVLEEQPKWGLLYDILSEVEHDISVASDHEATILVMVEEKRTCSQLKEYVSARSTQDDDSKMTPILSRLARNYFRWKAGIAQINQQLKSELKGQASGARGSAGQDNSAMRGKAPPNKRRRVRGASAIAAASEAFSRPLADTFQQDILENIDALDAEYAVEKPDMGIPLDPTLTVSSEISYRDILPHFDEIPPSEIVTIRQYTGEADSIFLEHNKPKFIIMYDPDPAFVRRVEVYRASHPEREIRVYFMVYDNSVEEQRYLSSIRQEKEAFEKLIREKSIMAVPIINNRKHKDEEEIFLKTISTRIGGGTRLKSTSPTVSISEELKLL
ncbi:DNA repair protein RAD16 [Umbelopsis sp. WA50703]